MSEREARKIEVGVKRGEGLREHLERMNQRCEYHVRIESRWHRHSFFICKKEGLEEAVKLQEELKEVNRKRRR